MVAKLWMRPFLGSVDLEFWFTAATELFFFFFFQSINVIIFFFLEQDTFLDHLQFQTLTDEVKKELDNDLTTEEISQSIQNINSGKAPGPDGLPIEFYKTFKEKLLVPL